MRKLLSKMDIPLLLIMLIFIVLGLTMIYSASSVSSVVRYGYAPYHFFVRQAIFVGVSLFVGFTLIIRLPTRTYGALAWPLLIAIILALVLLFIKGEVTNNAQSWYDFGFFSLQPSEFAKSILIVFMAVFYNKLNYKKTKNIYSYLIPLASGALIAGLVIMQPDLGSAAIIAGIVFLTFISIPLVKNNMIRFIKIIAIGLVIGLIVLLYSGADFLNSMQIDRLTFQNPCSRYTETTGYQVCNGFIAINNGGLFGVGLGNSTQKYLYLPESHTDFIFPIIVEELGLVTGILIILGYIFMLYRILKIAKSSENLRCSVLAYGTFWFLTLHILVNLLGILALIPLTGVPLPFLSYGGSFTVNVIIMLFVVERVNIENNINKTKREIKAL
ncbi:MAG TPA: FtsW/RodA/SpoVE family cell cycle protein [Candidatus Onthocola stercorigallinarum]|nr:FtsW/RodA/SpoVE family cell cycle protein [Candidatus Onthocola stercorigallinarum]